MKYRINLKENASYCVPSNGFSSIEKDWYIKGENREERAYLEVVNNGLIVSPDCLVDVLEIYVARDGRAIHLSSPVQACTHERIV